MPGIHRFFAAMYLALSALATVFNTTLQRPAVSLANLGAKIIHV
jgi:hypothetical protein